MKTIVVATIKEWNVQNYFELKKKFSDRYKFHLITNKEDLTFESLRTLDPKFVFFPHWSWMIKQEVYENFKCIVFHMTDLPYGRGGSPFQNLIMNKVYDTKISALEVDGGLDTGEVYMKEPFNISVGSAEENFIELSKVVFNKMIPGFLNCELTPEKQEGKVVDLKEGNIKIVIY